MSATETITNGEGPKSQFIEHLTSYPLVNDSVEMYKHNPMGKRSIDLAQGTYNRIGKPVVSNLQGPYSLVKPYVEKADSMANNGLDYVDEKFPIVKTETETVKQTAVDYITWPINLLFQTRDYVFRAYDDEWNKTGSERGVVHTGKAVISTELRVVSDTIHVVQSYLGPKRDEAVEWAHEKKDQISGQINGAQEFVQEKATYAQQQAQKAGNQALNKAGEVIDMAQEKAGQAQQQAQEAGQQAKATANDAANKTQEKAGQAQNQAQHHANKAGHHAKAHAHEAADKTKEKTHGY